MSTGLCCMSHSPLLNLPGPSQDLLDDIDAALAAAREFVTRLRPRARRDLLPGSLQRVLLPADAAVLHRHRTPSASATSAPTRVRWTFPATSPPSWREAVLDAGVDVAISASMDVDHGTVQPLQTLFGDAAGRPVMPIFINSVATPLGPLQRARALGAAVGNFLATLGKRVLVVGSGGLSHDPPVPTLATAPPAALGRIVHGEPMTAEQRQARQSAVMAAAHDFAQRRQHSCVRSTRNGTMRCWKLFDSGHRCRGRRLVQLPGSRTRRATRPTKSARGWRRSPRWPRKGRTRPGTATTAPRPS